MSSKEKSQRMFDVDDVVQKVTQATFGGLQLNQRSILRTSTKKNASGYKGKKNGADYFFEMLISDIENAEFALFLTERLDSAIGGVSCPRLPTMLVDWSEPLPAQARLADIDRAV